MSKTPYTILVCPVCKAQIEMDHEHGALCWHDDYGSVEAVTVAVKVNELDGTLKAFKPRLLAQRADQTKLKAERAAEDLRRSQLTEDQRKAEDKARWDALSPMQRAFHGVLSSSSLIHDINRQAYGFWTAEYVPTLWSER